MVGPALCMGSSFPWFRFSWFLASRDSPRGARVIVEVGIRAPCGNLACGVQRRSPGQPVRVPCAYQPYRPQIGRPNLPEPLSGGLSRPGPWLLRHRRKARDPTAGPFRELIGAHCQRHAGTFAPNPVIRVSKTLQHRGHRRPFTRQPSQQSFRRVSKTLSNRPLTRQPCQQSVIYPVSRVSFEAVAPLRPVDRSGGNVPEPTVVERVTETLLKGFLTLC